MRTAIDAACSIRMPHRKYILNLNRHLQNVSNKGAMKKKQFMNFAFDACMMYLIVIVLDNIKDLGNH